MSVQNPLNLPFIIVASLLLQSAKPAFAFPSASPDTGSGVVYRAPLSGIPESSGLAFTDGRLWTFGDSGNPATLYAVDTTSGKMLQSVMVDNYPNVDWEDIAADQDFIYVGDFGNNNGTRTDLRILKIAKKDISEGQNIHVNAEAIQFSYVDQETYSADSKTNFDCEALISFGDTLFIFTKDHRDYKTRIYALPKVPGDYVAKPLGEYYIGGLVTGADYDQASNTIILIGYDGSKLNSFLCILNGFPVSHFFNGAINKVKIGNNTKWQTEGVCFVSPAAIFISCESTSDIPASLYSYALNQPNITVAPEVLKKNVECFPNPASDEVTIRSGETIHAITVSDTLGRELLHLPINARQYTLSLKQGHFGNGTYLFEIQLARQVVVVKVNIQN